MLSVELRGQVQTSVQNIRLTPIMLADLKCVEFEFGVALLRCSLSDGSFVGPFVLRHVVVIGCLQHERCVAFTGLAPLSRADVLVKSHVGPLLVENQLLCGSVVIRLAH